MKDKKTFLIEVRWDPSDGVKQYRVYAANCRKVPHEFQEKYFKSLSESSYFKIYKDVTNELSKERRSKDIVGWSSDWNDGD